MKALLVVLVVVLFVVLLAFDLVHRALDSDDSAVVTARRPPPAAPATSIPPTTTVPTPPTTARARTAPTVRTTSIGPPVVAGELQDEIRAGFARFGPEIAEQAVHVAGCESTGDETGEHLDPAAINGDHSGLFQLARRYHEDRARRLGFTWDQMLQPGPNIAVAADLFAEHQWGPWTCRWAAA